MTKRELRLPAIRVRQGGERSVFVFSADGKDVCEFSTISRLSSGGISEVFGYQRPEAAQHIAEIRLYIEGEAPILPNSIVLAFDSSVSFEPRDAETESDAACHGTLVVRWDTEGDRKSRPAFVVDGQQRLAAIRDASVSGFNVCATAFVTDDADAQREQFLLLNNTKPLPKSLIYELLPGTGALLPNALERKRLPALLTRRLNFADESPFRDRIRIATNPRGTIRDNSVMRMIQNSLSDGALMRMQLRDELHEEEIIGDMEALLATYWSAVAETWPEAWSAAPRHSRLVHGAGIISMGFVMDEICHANEGAGGLDLGAVRADLQDLSEACHWMSGSWQFGEGSERAWNEIQNTGKDIRLLSNFLLRKYRAQLRGKSKDAAA